MKKALAFILSLSGFLFLAVPSFAAADTGTAIDLCNTANGDGQFSLLCSFSVDKFGLLIGQLLTLIFVVSIVAALFYLVWGGFKWLTSGGDKTAVGAAREHIIAAIVGLVVIFLAYFILNVLVHFFTGEDLSGIKIPTLGQSSSTVTCSGAKPKKCSAGGATICCKASQTCGQNLVGASIIVPICKN